MQETKTKNLGGRPAKGVAKYTTTLEEDLYLWAKAHFGPRGMGPWIEAQLKVERERVENEGIIARYKATQGGTP